jgi:GTP cyclohydrolase IA
LFDVEYDEMVIVRDIEFFSLCEHHMLPFIGRAHVAYIPRGKVIGLSKIPRIVDMFARRLQVQERMTRQVAEFLEQLLNPLGVAVVVEGLHLCAMMRGVGKHDARMTTSTMLGGFRTKLATRMEFLDNISRGAEKLHI